MKTLRLFKIIRLSVFFCAFQNVFEEKKKTKLLKLFEISYSSESFINVLKISKEKIENKLALII